jgi:hypothetical protein
MYLRKETFRQIIEIRPSRAPLREEITLIN